MNWLSPIEGINYVRGSRPNYLAPWQIKEVKQTLRGMRSRTRARSDAIRDLSVRFGKDEGTIRRAAHR